MTETENPPAGRGLKRTLTTRDLVLFNLVAVLGLRWLATSAKSGPSALTLWVLAALFFFIPQGLAVAELSTRYPDEGGIYSWTRRRFGDAHGYFCGWCYWVVNVLYYPQLLISSAVIATFVVGKGGSTLGDQWAYVLPCCLIMLWVAVLLNIVGVETGKWLQNLGGIGTYLTGILIIIVGVYAVCTHPSVNPIHWHDLIPNFSNFDEVNLWASIAFAFAGLELGATMAGEVDQPKRTLPRAVLLSAPLIAGCYLLGTVAIVWIVPTDKVNIVSGFLQVIDLGARHITPALWWLGAAAAAAYTIGNIGGIGAWLAGPARIAFVIGLDKYFPPAFGKIHKRWGTPYVAILVPAVAASLLLLLPVLGKGTDVEKFYLIMLDAQVLIYFVPYLYMFGCLLSKEMADNGKTGGGRTGAVIPGGAVGRGIVGTCGILVTLFAMGVAMVHPSDETTLSWIEKVVGGAGAVFLLGGYFYWRAASKGPAATGEQTTAI